ncbi:MAG: class I SAM-dependent methyltransferase [Gemmatimonadaceae bacterium]
MNARDRRALLGSGAPRPGESWADLGCGTGSFTIPLATALGVNGSLVAMDRNPSAIDELRRTLANVDAATLPAITLHVGDLTDLRDLPRLDGALLANVLHYLAEPEAVLRTLGPLVRHGGRILVIEYDRRDANQWVPFPIPVEVLGELAGRAGIPRFVVGPRVRSDFGRVVYAAVSQLGS